MAFQTNFKTLEFDQNLTCCELSDEILQFVQSYQSKIWITLDDLVSDTFCAQHRAPCSPALAHSWRGISSQMFKLLFLFLCNSPWFGSVSLNNINRARIKNLWGLLMIPGYSNTRVTSAKTPRASHHRLSNEKQQTWIYSELHRRGFLLL